MAELVNPTPYWKYDENEMGVITKKPMRATAGEPYDWPYGVRPKVGDPVIVTSNRDSDQEIGIEWQDENYYIWHECVEPAVKPIPDNVDLKNPTDIEKFLKEDA